jgi:hypothetical protein
MKIFPHDHILRFRFESETRKDISHVVDLGGCAGYGECSCEDFCYRVRPALAAIKDGTFTSRAAEAAAIKRCKHLMAAREHLLDLVIARVSEGERGME